MIEFHDAAGLRHFLVMQTIKEIAEYNTKKYVLSNELTKQESLKIKSVIKDVYGEEHYAIEEVDELIDFIINGGKKQAI